MNGGKPSGRRSPILDTRLKTILSNIEGRVLADIGTDHAYIPISACLTGAVDRAIACDIHPEPLKRAGENILAYGLSERIDTRLGDGLAPLSPGEADCLVLSGMGGLRIVEILVKGIETARSAKRILLQPQHDLPPVRRKLHIIGFYIEDEHLLQDNGHFYHVIVARPQKNAETYTDTEYRLGKCLLDRKDPVLWKYLERESEKISGYLSQMSTGQPKPDGNGRAAELTELMHLYQSILHGKG